MDSPNTIRTPVPRAVAAIAPVEPDIGLDRAAAADDPSAKHLATDHLLKDLRSRTVSSGFVTTFSQGVQFLLNMGSMMVLARLLAPEDFGLVAMVLTVMGFMKAFKDAGLSTATIQREGITQAQVSNLFWINIGISGFITLLLAAGSPLIAKFFHEPRLINIVLILSVTFVLAGSSVQHLALLKRQMRFSVLATIEITSMLCSVTVGITMAWRHCGYWSLVGVQLAAPLATCIMTWIASGWRPHLPSRNSGVKPLVRFGASVTTSGFVYSTARESDCLLVGRVFGPDSVGLYSRASALLVRPLEQFMNPINAVFVPTLSRLQDQPERYRKTFLRVFETLALTCFLFTGLLLPLGKPIILVVLGKKWEAAALIFSGFTLAALFHPLATASAWLFSSQGRGRDWLIQSVTVSTLTVAAFIGGIPFGPSGVAVVYSLSCIFILLPIYFYTTGRRGPVSTRDLWFVFLRQVPLWVVVCGVTWLTNSSTKSLPPLIQLLISVPVGLLAGITFIFLYPPSRRVALDFIEMLRGKIPFLSARTV